MASAPRAVCARPPQSWWLAGSHISRGTVKMAGRWILFQPREIPPSLAIADSSGRQIIWLALSSRLADPQFQFVLP